MSQNNQEHRDPARWFRDWMPVVMVFIAGVVWGMKLDGALTAMRGEVADMKMHLKDIDAKFAQGISPRADERLNALVDRIERLESQCEKAQEDMRR